MLSLSSKALLLTAILLTGCSDQEKLTERETVDAPVVTVQRVSLPSFYSVAGTVRSDTTSTLAANVVGAVVRVNVAEGDRVRAGQVLVEIDARERRALGADPARARHAATCVGARPDLAGAAARAATTCAASRLRERSGLGTAPAVARPRRS